MPIKDGREYRAIEIKNFTASEEEDSYIVEGYATTFDDPYDFGRGGMKECIKRSAMDGADMSDVIFQFDHQGMVMARQRNNSLAVMCDDHGLYVKADLSGTRQGRDLHEAIKNGLVDRMSWAFTVADDGWDYDPNTRTSYVTKVDKVYDVSAVSIPANEGTEISARSYFDGVIEGEQQELLKRSKDADMRKRAAAALKLSTLTLGEGNGVRAS